MTALPLVFDAPKRGLPPRHLADLDPADRRAAVAELGQPAFRADQRATEAELAAVRAEGLQPIRDCAAEAEALAFPPPSQLLPVFAGTSGRPNCSGQSVSVLAQQYVSIASAAAALGYSSVSDLMNAIASFCAG